MERVAFLVERTGEQISCLLNPETVVIRRTAGLRSRNLASGIITGQILTDDPVIATGGGITEIDLDLLFDTDLDREMRQRPDPDDALDTLDMPFPDVRDLTRPIWNLAENGEGQGGFAAPPKVRLIWGRSWNIPGVVTAVAEKFERFQPDGRPQRSWLRMRLRRLDSADAAEPAPLPVSTLFEAPALEGLTPDQVERSDSVLLMPDEFGLPSPRIDQIVAKQYGDLSLLGAILDFNGIDDPLCVLEGQVLILPDVTQVMP